MKLRRVNKKNRCKVCGHDSYCGYSEDGAIAICMRVESERQTKNRGWLHVLKERLPEYKPTPSVRNNPLAPREHLDAIYSTLLQGHLVLSKDHRERLRLRGIDDPAITRNGYRSIPTELYFNNAARALSGYDLKGVPGFYQERGQWKATQLPPGIFIPVRDSRNRIRALQARLDEGATRYLWFSSSSKPEGVSSGAPVHFARPELIEHESRLFITEGALKADVIAARIHAPVIGLAGVTTWPGGFGQKLRKRLPTVTEIQLCFDSDFKTNPHVKKALFNLISELRLAGYSPSVLVWDAEYKGLDDYLVRKAA